MDFSLVWLGVNSGDSIALALFTVANFNCSLLLDVFGDESLDDKILLIALLKVFIFAKLLPSCLIMLFLACCHDAY